MMLGLIVPVPLTFLFAGLLKIVQEIFGVIQSVEQSKMILLAVASDLLVMRYYLLKKKYENTSKGVLLITLALVIAYFVMLHNKSFSIF